MGFPIKFFEDGHFGKPIQEFLEGLTIKQRAKALYVMMAVQTLEHVHGGYLKKLHGTHDIWEIRVEFAGDLQRYLGILDEGNLVLLHAFVKKTQKTPAGEIALAETRARQYLQKRAQK